MKLSGERRKKQLKIYKMIAAGIPLTALLSTSAYASETQVHYVGLPRPEQPLMTQSSQYHIVKKNDTLSKIAKKYNTTVKILRDLNKFSSEEADNLRPGQKIILPQNNSANENKNQVRGKMRL